MNTQEMINNELQNVLGKIKNSVEDVKRFALGEAWKLLQIVVASVIQVIEKLGDDLEGPEKKAIAMDVINGFYDSVFVIIDIPYLPNLVESMIHRYIKTILMILVSSTIDSMVSVFKSTGVFLKEELKVEVKNES